MLLTFFCWFNHYIRRFHALCYQQLPSVDRNKSNLGKPECLHLAGCRNIVKIIPDSSSSNLITQFIAADANSKTPAPTLKTFLCNNNYHVNTNNTNALVQTTTSAATLSLLQPGQLEIITNVIDALNFIHKAGYLHGNFSSHNILVSKKVLPLF